MAEIFEFLLINFLILSCFLISFSVGKLFKFIRNINKNTMPTPKKGSNSLQSGQNIFEIFLAYFQIPNSKSKPPYFQSNLILHFDILIINQKGLKKLGSRNIQRGGDRNQKKNSRLEREKGKDFSMFMFR